MKKYLLLLTILVCFKTGFSQITVAPSKDLEYCPLSNTIFTVTVPGYDPFVFGSTNNPIVASANYPPINPSSSTTFTFVGRFQDVNISQTYGVR